jgi:hypothetical protein
MIWPVRDRLTGDTEAEAIAGAPEEIEQQERVPNSRVCYFRATSTAPREQAMVGLFFIDFANALIVTSFVNRMP